MNWVFSFSCLEPNDFETERHSHLHCCCCLVTKSYPTLCDPVDRSQANLSVGSQARILEWVALSFSKGSFWPRNWIYVSHITSRFFTVWASKEVGVFDSIMNEIFLQILQILLVYKILLTFICWFLYPSTVLNLLIWHSFLVKVFDQIFRIFCL